MSDKDHTTIYEIKEIMDYFDIGHADGFIIGKQCLSILSFLREYSGTGYDVMKKRLAFKLQCQYRYLQEKLDSIESWGIIEVRQNENNLKTYEWIGIKALRRKNKNNGESEK